MEWCIEGQLGLLHPSNNTSVSWRCYLHIKQQRRMHVQFRIRLLRMAQKAKMANQCIICN